MVTDNWTPYTPLGAHIIIRPFSEEERRSTGGVLLPDNVAVQKAEGVVLAVGPGEPGKPKPEFTVGDYVFFPPWLAHWETHMDTGLEFCCIHADLILGVCTT